ncbi:MAG: hypothetical protein LBV67_00510, partial [Streptococcaceae bacterium]|nr:hypothetical protein [Streptococcaceae bacterium]
MITTKDLKLLDPIFFKADGFLANILGEMGQNFITNLCYLAFGFNKFLYEAISGLMKLFYSQNIFMANLDTFFNFSKNIYLNAFDLTNHSSIGFLLMFVLTIVAGYKYISNQRNEAKSLFFRMILVFVIATAWFGGANNNTETNGIFYMTTVENIANSLEAGLLKATGLTTAGNIGGTVNLEDLNNDPSKVATDIYFQKAVVEPFLLMNYGTTDENELKILGIDVREFIDGTDENKQNALDKAKEQYNDEKEGGLHDTRGYLHINNAVFKLMVSIFSTLGNFSIGIPLLMISFLRFIFQMGALFLVVAIPASLVIALFPTKQQNSLKNIFGNFVGMLFGKAFLSVGIVALFLLYNLIDTIIQSSTLPMYMGNGAMKLMAVFFLWKNREKLFRKLGLASVTNTVNKTAKATKDGVNMAKNAVNKEKLQRVALSTASKMPLPPQAKMAVKAVQGANAIKGNLSQRKQQTTAQGKTRSERHQKNTIPSPITRQQHRKKLARNNLINGAMKQTLGINPQQLSMASLPIRQKLSTASLPFQKLMTKPDSYGRLKFEFNQNQKMDLARINQARKSGNLKPVTLSGQTVLKNRVIAKSSPVKQIGPSIQNKVPKLSSNQPSAIY